MTIKLYNWLTYFAVVSAMIIFLSAIAIYFQGGTVQDVGQAVSRNMKEIEEVKAIVRRGRDERYVAQELYLQQVKESKAQVDQLMAEVEVLEKKLDKCTGTGKKQ